MQYDTEIFTYDCLVDEEDILHIFQWREYDIHLDNLCVSLPISEDVYLRVHYCCFQCDDEDECTCGCVCHEIYAASVEYLRIIATRDGWGDDEFERCVNDEEELYNTSLGPTNYCLTMTEIGQYMSSDRDKFLNENYVSEIQKHFGECRECFDNVELWENFKE